MNMINTATLDVVDHDSQGLAQIIVRHNKDYTGLTLSLLEGSDTALYIEKKDIKKLISVLQETVKDE